MTELPERKVLKDLLLKLKSKTITSADELQMTEQIFIKEMERYQKQLSELLEDKDVKKYALVLDLTHNIRRLVDTVSIYLKDYSNSVHRNTAESALYIEALEKYSAELDNTLTSLFEQARKQAEEQIKQQEELSKRTSSASYTA